MAFRIASAPRSQPAATSHALRSPCAILARQHLRLGRSALKWSPPAVAFAVATAVSK